MAFLPRTHISFSSGGGGFSAAAVAFRRRRRRLSGGGRRLLCVVEGYARYVDGSGVVNGRARTGEKRPFGI